LEETIKSKLNVKKITYKKEIEGSKIEIRLNQSKVGKDFKQDSVKLRRLITDEVIQQIYKDGSVRLENFELTREHIIVDESLPANLIGSDFIDGKVILETERTPELEEEGFVRELIRRIQDLRKENKLKKEDRIKLSIKFEIDISKWKDTIKSKVGAKEIYLEDKDYSIKETDKIRDKEFIISMVLITQE